MIFFENWNLRVEGQSIAQQFDHLTRTVTVVGDIPVGWDWVMLVQVGEFMDMIPLADKEGILSTALTARQLSVTGYYKVQLRGTRGEQVKHTNVIDVYISASLSGNQKWPEVPSEFTELEHRSSESAKKAETAAAAAQSSAGEAKTAADHADTAKAAAQNAAASAGQSANNAAASEQAAARHKAGAEKAVLEAEGYTLNPPTVGENGNWFLWDGKKYVDSGQPSQGADGADGKDGHTPVKGVDYFDGAPGELTRTQGNDLYANTLKGVASGAAIRVEDVSPLEHTVSVKVSSKNLYFNNSTTTTMVQGTLALEKVAGKSEFVLNGAATAEYSVRLSSGIPLKAGTYTVSLHGTNIIGSAWDRIYVTDASDTIVATYVRNGVPKTFTIENDTTVSVQMVVGAGTSYENATCSVQIEEGTNTTQYVPHVDDLTTVNIRTSGKNLSPVTNIVTTTNNKAGKFVISDIKEPGTYTLSANITKFSDDTATDTRMNVTVTYSDGHTYAYISERDTSFAENDGVARFKSVVFEINTDEEVSYITVFPLDYSKLTGGVRNAKAENIQLEYSSSATDFEEYKRAAYIPAEDGTCRVASIAPLMTLLTDNANVTMKCEYNRDINKAFEELVQAIISMGGNV